MATTERCLHTIQPLKTLPHTIGVGAMAQRPETSPQVQEQPAPTSLTLMPTQDLRQLT